MPEPRTVEDYTKEIRLTDDGILILFGMIATRDFPTDQFGHQVVKAFREKFADALRAYRLRGVTETLERAAQGCDQDAVVYDHHSWYVDIESVALTFRARAAAIRALKEEP